jgi:hypothetical protein
MGIIIQPINPSTGRPYPRKRVLTGPCSACAGGYCQPGWCVDGHEFDLVREAPVCDVALGNAGALLAAAGLSGQEGEIDAMEVAGVLADCEAAMRSDVSGLVARAGMLRERESTPNLIISASTDANAIDRLGRLRAVLVWALENGAGIAWN